MVLDILFVLAVSAALMSNFFGVPGNIIIAINSLIYGVITNFNSFSLTFVLTLFIIVILVEFLEYLMIALTAKKYGASKWGITGGIIGGQFAIKTKLIIIKRIFALTTLAAAVFMILNALFFTK